MTTPARLRGHDRAVEAVSLDEAVARVRRLGGRLTAARRELLEDLHQAPGRLTVDQLAQRHPRLDGATLYRALAQFETAGVIDHVHLGHGPSAYRWVGHGSVSVVCEGCGKVVEIPADELEPLSERLRERYGVALAVGHFALPARCHDCS